MSSSQNARIGLIWIAVFCAATPPPTAQAADRFAWGDRVMPKQGAVITAPDGKPVSLDGRLLPLYARKTAAGLVDVGYGTTPEDSLVAWAEAEAYYTDWIRREPQAVAAYDLRGELRGLKLSFSEAIDDYTEAIRLAPRNARLHSKRALAHLGLSSDRMEPSATGKIVSDRPSEEAVALAEKDAARALIMDSGEILPLIALANVFDLRNEKVRALAQVHLLRVATPGDDYSRLQRAAAEFSELNFPIVAAKDCDFLIEKYPFQPAVFHRRATLHRIAGEFSQAFADYDEAIRLTPNFAGLYFIRSHCHAYCHQWEQAIKDVEDGYRLSANKPQGSSYAFLIYARAPRPTSVYRSRALELAKVGYAADPKNWAYCINMAAALAMNSDFEQAKTLLVEADRNLPARAVEERAAIKAYQDRVSRREELFRD